MFRFSLSSALCPLVVAVTIWPSLATAQTNPPPPDEPVGWGYYARPESARDATARKERVSGLLPVLARVEPEATTDLILPDLSFAHDATRGRAVRVRTPLNRNQKPFFWIVDPATNTYRIFVLNDVDADVRRIESYLNGKGQSVSATRLREQLTLAATRAAKLRQQSVASRPGGVHLSRRAGAGRGTRSSGLQAFFCTGGIDAGVTAYDPVLITLTDTFSWAHWTRDDYGIISYDVGGHCYANPNTGISTWFLDSCVGNVTYDLGYPYLDVSTAGDYHNDDFGSIDERTWVFQLAAVNFAAGFLSWDTFHFDDGEFSSLIFGWTYVPHMYEDCYPM